MHPLLDLLDREVADALAGLSARDTQKTPEHQTQKWSVQQIIEHLLLTYRSTGPVLEARLHRRSPTLAVPTWLQRYARWRVLGVGRFPGGRTAPASVTPRLPVTVQSGAELTGRVHADLYQMDVLLRAGEQMFGTQRAASHQSLGPLSMQQWRRFHLVHGRHHLRQIARIRRQYGL